MVVLPFWKKTLTMKIKEFRFEPVTVGDHIRQKRLKLKLTQREVALDLGVTTDCVTLWEKNHSEPLVHNFPLIIKFLGYNPLMIDTKTLGGQIKKYRYDNGLSHRNMGAMLSVDSTTIRDWELNKRIPKYKSMEQLLNLLSQGRKS